MLDSAMAGASEDTTTGAGEEAPPGPVETRAKRGLGGSMSLRTRKLGRRLSRSMSIVALKLPEKAQSITRSSSKLMRSGSRDKKNRSFELSIILPDKTQKQVTVWGNSTVAEVACEPLREVGAVVAGLPTGPLSAPQAVPLGSPLLSLTAFPAAPPAGLLFLGGSKAPVEPRASAAVLEGEVLVVEYQPPQWDGRDLETFIAWEKIYASTLFSAVELYGKPLLRAAVITKEEYHLLFYYLESVSEASEALTERMRKYIDSGLLNNEVKNKDDEQNNSPEKSVIEDEPKSLLTELIQEGVLSQQDVDASSVITGSEFNESTLESRKTDDDSVSSISPSLRKVIVDIPIDCNESVADSTISSDNITTVMIRNSGQCCADHRISADVEENVWANVRWDFLNPSDFGYDQVRCVKRSRSESALTPVAPRKNDDLYERLQLQDVEGESCGSITPYESIEDLYDCIKNAQYSSPAAEESTPSTESQSEPQFPDYFEKTCATRQSSASSEKSGASSAFPFSKCGSASDSTDAFTSCESTSGISNFAPKSIAKIKNRELPPPPVVDGSSESAILLKQLFSGELMDAYGEFLAAYPYARALLRRKARRDEHFTALADIRRGAAKHTIADYLELPLPLLIKLPVLPLLTVLPTLPPAIKHHLRCLKTWSPKHFTPPPPCCTRYLHHQITFKFLQQCTSDSEYDSEVSVVAPPPVPPPTKKPKTTKASKRKVAPVANAAALAHRPEPSPLLAPPSSSQELEFPWTKKRRSDIFSILKAEEKASSSTAAHGSGGSLTSSFSTRVSGGQSRRTVPVTDGNFFVELKLYNLVDVQNTPPEERYKKALTSVKLRLGENSREWESLQDFLAIVFNIFKQSNPTKFSDRVKFK